MKNSLLLYEDVPRYDSWLKPLLSGFVAFFLLLGLIFLYFNTELAIVMFALSAFIALLFTAIVPRRFQIFEDRLIIQLGWPFTLNIPLENIDKARHGSSGDIIVYWGIKLGTSTSNVIEIVRNKGMNVVITPVHFNEFLNQLNQAVQSRPDQNNL
jgi:hypothetical protein